MGYQAYPDYKDSGVEWQPKIPTHWTVSRLKFMASIQNGCDYKAVESDDGIPVFGSGGIFTAASAYLYDGESVLFGRKGTIDKPLHVQGKFWTVDTMFYSVINPNTVGRYLYYFATIIQYERLATQTALPSITQQDLGNYLLFHPAWDEQQKIAHFLDHKTAQIDRLIEKKQELIEKLQEQRITIITQAVTKGLDSRVRMKDSGVEWLGKIPAHWNVKRLRFLVSTIEQGWSPQCNNEMADDDAWGVLKVGCVNGNTFNENENKALPGDLEPKYEYEIKPGDILVSRANTKELLGSAALINKETRGKLILCDKLYRLNTEEHIDKIFIVHFLRSRAARNQYEMEASGASSSMQNIGQDTIKNLIVCVPPDNEQKELVAQIEELTQKIDTAVILNTQAIERLQEYRTALITAAVTGQIDVRDWQAPQSLDTSKPDKEVA